MTQTRQNLRQTCSLLMLLVWIGFTLPVYRGGKRLV